MIYLNGWVFSESISSNNIVAVQIQKTVDPADPQNKTAKATF